MAPAAAESGVQAAPAASAADAAELVDQIATLAKLAAALLVVDPHGLGGAVVHAQAGPVRDAWLAALRSLLPRGMPLLRMPHHISDDRLLGGLDLSATLAAGRPVAQAGLLAAADGGLVQIHMAERMSGSTAAHLCAVLDTGELRVERDGLSARHSSRFAVIALDEALPDDTPLSPALADRLGLVLNLNSLSLRQTLTVDEDWQQAVQSARSLLPQVMVDEATLQALCATALALGVHSARATWWALRATRAAAALQGRLMANADDAAAAVQLVLAPRATQQPVRPVEDDVAADDAPPQPPDGNPDSPEDEPRAAPELAATEPPPPPSLPDIEPVDEPENAPESMAALQDVQTLQDQLIAAATSAMPPGLLALLARLAQGETPRAAAAAAGRAGATAASRHRGRPLGAKPGAPHAGARLHLMATLRAAAPWQRLRRQSVLDRATPSTQHTPRVLVRAQDFHIRHFEQRRTTTTVFAIDASGSSALHRLAEAKGAVELLLAECYVRRDEVAVLAFRGRAAELLLPPTRSLVRAKRSLAGLPGGGGTPLAAGIAAAAALADQVRRKGATPVVVLLTDGRANVARSGEGGRAQAQQDAISAARALRAQGGHVLLIDTSPRAEPAALALAVAMGARYLALPQADAATLSRAIAGRA